MQTIICRFQRLCRHLTLRAKAWSLLVTALSIFALVVIKAVAGGPPAPDVPGILLNSWRFNDTNWLSIRGDGPLAFYGIEAVESWSSNSVEISNPGALLQYAAVPTNGWTNLTCARGTVFFWFLPNWTSVSSSGNGPGSYGRFIDLGVYTTNASYGWWSLYLDPQGTNIFFGSQTNGAGATYVSAPIDWSSNDWRFIALTYSSTNSAIYVDGELITTGSGVSYWPSTNVINSSGFTLGGDSYGTNLAKGQFENLVTFDYPLSAEFIAAYYNLVIQYIPGESQSMSASSEFSAFETFNSNFGYLMGLQACGTNVLRFVTPQRQGSNMFIEFSDKPVEVFDLFYSTNFVNWSFYARSALYDTSFTFTNALDKCFFLLGKMQDVNGINGTDAYELLIGHTDPWSNLVPLKVFITQPSAYSIIP